MTKELDTMEQINAFSNMGMKVAKELYGNDIEETEFTIIQPLADGQGMILQVKDNEDGERTMSLNAVDTLTILPVIDATLDIYGEEEEQ
ncbi:TPA_asm: hypothetical protein GEU53_13870 [Listeria monocytogenes]|uniref:hypothetical protein n=1 Tax=Listeria monocytogenes TaxID=1639 RepID=UPI000766D33F|nr:hypothetical protein [Listeria monocytogenes]CWU46431.1 Uncharacterised protein [Listeria monocytogenes]HAA3060943.1 hypothetical protein [Listeria monocytogenes]HAA3225552.1 hypothetical protein [Listeria monocytogenes]HAA4774925.1 hypothetical protein [Listeria monocytogenes]HAA5448788.1 hypothetical protein [Listeria monocytogenes]